MRILHLSQSDLIGGGCVSAYRLHHALLDHGVDSLMMVARSVSGESRILKPMARRIRGSGYIISKLEQSKMKRSTGGNPLQFSLSHYGFGLRRAIDKCRPDLINLHWINGGFASVRDIESFTGIPSVWTFHDMWAFTGGCHYAYKCNRFADNCGKCPQLNSEKLDDVSRTHLQEKKNRWVSFSPEIVTPSKWLAKEVSRSSIFGKRPVHHIPYGIDLEMFNPSKRALGRQKLGIAEKIPVILFGALAASEDKRKGFDLLVDGLLSQKEHLLKNRTEFVIFGNLKANPLPPELRDFKIHELGHISNPEELALTYAAADVFIAPSRADNLPNTVLEATACGTPTIAFRIGGMPDMIDDGQTGYLIEPFDTVALGQRIVQFIEAKLGLAVRVATRKKAEAEFPFHLQAERYASLYSRILK